MKEFERTLKVDLNTAQRWYAGNNEALSELASIMFTEEELIGKEKLEHFKKQRQEEYRKEKQERCEAYREWRNDYNDMCNRW